jgi:GAF domain-containing protein
MGAIEAEGAAADADVDVDAGLRELSTLLFTQETLESTMQRIAAVAARCVCAGATPGGATVLLLSGDEPFVAAATDDRVRAVEHQWLEAREGPCIDALKMGETIVVDNLGGDERYADVGPTVCALGVVAAVSAPLGADGEVVGTLSVYAGGDGAFDHDHVAAAELVAAQASALAVNAKTHAECQERIRQLQEALDSRVVIEQAKGILMERHGVDSQLAFQRLRERSQRENRRLRLVAEELVNLASGTPTREDGSRG